MSTNDGDAGEVDISQPHWEHGYRVHGLWNDAGQRLGAVGIGPRNNWDGVYHWWIDGCQIEGEAKTLRAAKREVERVIASSSPARVAEQCYTFADAMIVERERKPK